MATQQQRRRRRPEQESRGSDAASQAPATLSLNPAPRHPLRPPEQVGHADAAGAFAGSSRRQDAVPRQSFLRNGKSRDVDGAQKSSGSEKPKITALDRLEGWFGLSADQAYEHSASRGVHSETLLPPSSQERRSPKSNQNPHSKDMTTRLVLVHLIAPVDSLESLALRYGTDVGTLRRANGLWPGDSVQVRREIYVPVDESTSVQGQSSIHPASEDVKGQLRLMNGTVHSRQASSSAADTQQHGRAASTASATSATSSRQATSSPALRRMPSHALSYFPPPGTAQKAARSREDGEGGRSSSELLGLGPTARSNEGTGPGESGIEDLLQLAERARLRGSADEIEASTHAATHAASEDGDDQHLLAPSDSVSVTSSSPGQNFRALEEPWRPNKWTLGESRKRTTLQREGEGGTTQSTSVASSEISSSLRDDERGPAMMAAGYQGWNDVPEPPLSRTAKGQVAHAYKPKRRYPRPAGGAQADGASLGIDLPGSAFIDDLVAGLPANEGPAAHWARPIADCLPVSVDAKGRPGSALAARAGARGNRHGRNQTSSNAARHGDTHSSQSSPSSGWGQLFSDTVRGKMRLEDALERGLEDLRLGFASVAAGSGTRGASMQADGLPTFAQAGDHGASPTTPRATTSSAPPLAPRRQSGRSLHELVDMHASEVEQGGGASHARSVPRNPSSTSDGRSSVSTAPSASGMRGRKNARNVDWLS